MDEWLLKEVSSGEGYKWSIEFNETVEFVSNSNAALFGRLDFCGTRRCKFEGRVTFFRTVYLTDYFMMNTIEFVYTKFIIYIS